MFDDALYADLFGRYVGLWSAPSGVQRSNFQTCGDFLDWVFNPFMLRSNWCLLKDGVLVARSATYRG